MLPFHPKNTKALLNFTHTDMVQKGTAIFYNGANLSVMNILIKPPKDFCFVRTFVNKTHTITLYTNRIH